MFEAVSKGYVEVVKALARRAARYAFQVGLAEDQDLNALTGGSADQTFSLREAEQARRGDGVACFICWCLGWMVQRDHCKLTLAGQNIPPLAAVRAAFWITLVLGAPVWLIFHWVGG